MKAQQLIRDWVASEGRKLGWLAAQIPVHQGDLSRWLRSKKMPREVYRIRLSDITGLDVRDKALWEAVE